MEIAKIKGNEKTRNFLNKIVAEQNILHSYLFLGKEGIGKKLIAKEFAKKILCLGNKGNDDCKSCICFESNNHPDFTIINEESEIIKINQVRELIEKVIEKPILSNKKVYIINDADKMTVESQNCLLKTLEEPQEYMVIILIAENENKILNTIKSRCTKIVFEKLSNKDIKELLQMENKNIELTENMYDLFDGSIKRAKEMVQKKDLYRELDKLLDKILEINKLDFYLNGKKICTKEEIQDILEYLIVRLYKLGLKDEIYLNGIDIIQNTINKLNSNCNFDMSTDNMLFKLWEEINENNNRS